MAEEFISKPLLRGHFHQAAFFFSLGICSPLWISSYGTPAALSIFIYCLSLCTLFGVSALYHRPNWSASKRLWMRRLDHSCIFLLIAGTVTPICYFSLSAEEGIRVLKIIWMAAFIGILLSIFWVKKPKWVTALLCLTVGFLALPYLPDFYVSLGFQKVALLLIGSFFYFIGAMVYAFKFPDPSPKYFGYHEIFHLLVIVAAVFQFVVIYSLAT
jgi:hemolysin III